MDLSDAERIVETHGDYRLLRRVPASSEWRLPSRSSELRQGVFVDTETTGLDQDSDEVIELALLPFEYERDIGLIVRMDETGALSGVREPSFPIPVESTLVHGITNAEVAGHYMSAARVSEVINSAQLIGPTMPGLTGPANGGKALAGICEKKLGVLP